MFRAVNRLSTMICVVPYCQCTRLYLRPPLLVGCAAIECVVLDFVRQAHTIFFVCSYFSIHMLTFCRTLVQRRNLECAAIYKTTTPGQTTAPGEKKKPEVLCPTKKRRGNDRLKPEREQALLEKARHVPPSAASSSKTTRKECFAAECGKGPRPVSGGRKARDVGRGI